MNYYALSILASLRSASEQSSNPHYALRIMHYALCILLLTACNATKKADNGEAEGKAVEIEFNADSAYAFTAAQCDFGPRTMNSDAHEKCGMWIAEKFKSYGCSVELQKADLKGYDGTILKSTNIIARYNPDVQQRILICAHWDSRPWADNDPDEANHKTPVMAANDGASGVAIMLEVARLLSQENVDSTNVQQPSTNASIGIDFVCFDAEDWGVPTWSDAEDDGSSWALGAQYWASHLPQGHKPEFGILLDMVGGEGAQFHKEGMSQRYAPNIVSKVWKAAKVAGYGSFFPISEGGYVNDDHVPVNDIAQIPTIDIIPYYPDCQASSFGPTWHTINDTMEHIDKATLKAVGQTLIQVIYGE